MPSALPSILRLNQFSSFRRELEKIAGSPPSSGDGSVRDWVGGDMAKRDAPIDPLFFLHHAQVDRIWAIWQREHPEEAFPEREEGGEEDIPFGHALDDPMWPWDGGASTLDESKDSLKAFLPTLPTDDLARARDVLNTRELGYIYDGEDAAREFRETGECVGHDWSSIPLGSNYGPRPAVVAGIQTFAGTDTAVVRIRNAGGGGFDVKVQEERSLDKEIGHVEESIGYLAGEAGRIHDVSGRAVGELGTTSMGQAMRDHRERVRLLGSYACPVVVATIRTFNGPQPSHIRVTECEAGADSFFMFIEEWLYLDGHHVAEDVSYLVVEAGRHRLRDRSELEAGVVGADHKWTSVEFEQPFSGNPVVLSQCMTRNGPDPVVTRQRNVKAGGFEVRLQEEEWKTRDHLFHVKETIGYVALK